MSEEQTTNNQSWLRSKFNSFAQVTRRLNFMFQAQNSVMEYLQTAKPSEEQLVKIIKDQKEIQSQAQRNQLEAESLLIDGRVAKVHAIIRDLTDPQIPDFGQKYIEELKKSAVVTSFNPKLVRFADYVGYQSGAARTFVHNIGIPPDQMEGDIYPLVSSYVHEVGHAIPTSKADALKHTISNTQTKIVLHPVEFMKAMVISEEVAYTQQGFVNSLIAGKVPSVRKMSGCDAVSVDDIESYRSQNATLADALLNAALNALSKPLNVNYPNFTFRDHYHELALKNYCSAMSNRGNEKDLVFVRLEPEDFHAIGDLGYMPNPLGEHYIHHMFLEAPRLRKYTRCLLMDLLDDCNIPPLEDCMTLREAKQKAVYQNTPSPTPQETQAPHLQMAASTPANEFRPQMA